MASTAAPYGLRPVNMLGGSPMSHGIQLYKINVGYATSIFNGDLVTIGTNGFLEKQSGTPNAPSVGVFLGVEYEDATMGLLHRQYWPASTSTKANKPIWGYVANDPNLLFEIQASGSIDQADLGFNAGVVQTAGSTATGNSKVALDAAALAVTATHVLKIVGFVDRPGSSEGDAFTDVIVRINNHILAPHSTGIA